MRRVFVMLSFGLLVAATASASSRHEISESLELDGATEVQVELSVGELTIETVDGDLVQVDVELRCRSSSPTCERQLERVEIIQDRRSERLRVLFDGISKSSSRRMEVDVRVGLPKDVELSVDLGIGELEITGVERDVYADVGIGEVRLWLAGDAVGSVYLDAGIGEASLYGAEHHAESSRPFLVGSELAWEAGSGDSEIVVDLGIGEISVHLD